MVAVDGGGLVSTNEAHVTVNVVDRPFTKQLEFTESLYSFATVEGAPAGTIIGRMEAQLQSGPSTGGGLLWCLKNWKLSFDFFIQFCG